MQILFLAWNFKGHGKWLQQQMTQCRTCNRLNLMTHNTMAILGSSYKFNAW